LIFACQQKEREIDRERGQRDDQAVQKPGLPVSNPTMLDNLLAVWCVVAVVELAGKLVARAAYRPSSIERNIFVKMRGCKIEMKKHRGPESFVTKAKLERQLINLEKDASALKGVRTAKKGYWDTWLFRVKCLIYGLVVLYFWEPPLAQLPGWGLWPFGWLFAFPGHPRGSVGVVASVVVCKQGAERILSFL